MRERSRLFTFEGGRPTRIPFVSFIRKVGKQSREGVGNS
jgi:hypothetical protein